MDQIKTRMRDAKLGAAIDNACESLPDGFEIVISLECGSGVVSLFDPHGDERDYPSNHDEGAGGDIADALEYAKELELAEFARLVGLAGSADVQAERKQEPT